MLKGILVISFYETILLVSYSLIYLIIMKPDLLNYIDDVVNERLTLLHERESDPTWLNESEDLKAETEEEIKKCDEVLNEITKLQNIGEN